MRLCRTAAPELQLFTREQQLPNNWDDSLPEGHYLRRASLKTHEQAALPDVSFVYVSISHAGRLLAMAAFQVLTIRDAHLNPTSLQAYQRVAWKAFTAAIHPKLLVAGHLFRHDVSTFYVQPGIEPFGAFRLYQQAVEAALKESCAAAVLLKDPPAPLLTYFQQFTPDYLLLRNDVSMQMDLPESWDSFTDYEKALKHKYGQRTRKIRQHLEGLTIRELSTAEVAKYKSDLYQLYLQVTTHQPVRLGYLSETFLPLLKQQYPEGLKVWGFFAGETMVAFASAWVKETTFDMFYIGFDYSRNQELQLYFNILYFAIEQAILFRKPTLILGRTALEAKARLGCKPVYLQTYLYIGNRFLRNWVAGMQQKALASEGEWEDRHPFKAG